MGRQTSQAKDSLSDFPLPEVHSCVFLDVYERVVVSSGRILEMCIFDWKLLSQAKTGDCGTGTRKTMGIVARNAINVPEISLRSSKELICQSCRNR